MADDNDNGQDPNIELAPIKRGPGRPPKAPEPEPKADVATQLSKVLAQALGEVAGKKEPEVLLPEDRSEVRLRANKPFHLAAEHQAYSQIVGTAYGMEGMGLQLDANQEFVTRPGPHVDWLLEHGFARPVRS